jgi:hypothetical protein
MSDGKDSVTPRLDITGTDVLEALVMAASIFAIFYLGSLVQRGM